VRPAQSGPRETLVAGDSLYPLLVSSVRDYAIFALDSSGRIVSWNAGARRIKGYEAHEIIGQHFSVFYPQSDIDSGQPTWELEVATREGRLEDEGWRIRKDGARFWANVVITALRDEGGRLVGFAKVTRGRPSTRSVATRACWPWGSRRSSSRSCSSAAH
jgi:PAS domain S-box-containing protein